MNNSSASRQMSVQTKINLALVLVLVATGVLAPGG